MPRVSFGYSYFVPLLRCKGTSMPMNAAYGYAHSCQACLKLRYTSTNNSAGYKNTKKKYIELHSNITVRELAEKINVKATPIIKLLEDYGYDTHKGINSIVDLDIAEAVADEFDCAVVSEIKPLSEKKSVVGLMLPRPPVVTIMGHVDHGKTTLLDYLRKTSVAQQEVGGITQSIGAFSVQVPGLTDRVTFVDTPGHAAFNSMRARGAKLTDVVVLVIAADDGIMEQTVECLRHIKEAKVPLIVAINKVDKPKTNPERVKNELLRLGVQLEEFGGDIKCISISALKGINIDHFLVLLNDFSKENIFEASYDALVEGIVLEAESNKQKGIISSVLINQGNLVKGKVLLAGNAFAKVRQIFNASGQILKHAGPSDPVQILGWRSLPAPGDVVTEVRSEAEARDILKFQQQDLKPKNVSQKPLQKAPGKKGITEEFKSGRSKRIPYRVTLRVEASTGAKVEEDTGPKNLDIIIKADVSGSLEALVNVLNTFHSQDLKLNIMDASVGQVTDTDLQMANTFEGIVYSFNVQPSKDIITKAQKLNVSLKHFDIIYKLMDDLKEEIESMLPTQATETIIGEADVLKVFQLTGTRKNTAAGCRVRDGFLDNSDKSYLWKVMRNNEIIHEGSIKSLKRGVTDIPLAKKMTECGVTLHKYEQFEEGDKILCIKVEHIKQAIEWKI